MTGREYPEILHAGRVHGLPRLGSTDHEVGEAGFLLDVEHLVNPRTAHVRVDEQNTLSRLGDADGEVARRHRLAFPRPRAGHEDRRRAPAG